MTSRGMSLGYCVSGRPLYLVHLLCIVLFFFFRLLAQTICPDLHVLFIFIFYFFIFFIFFTTKDCPELESRFAERVRVAIEYASTIDDFDDFVDPRTLACHCFRPKPSQYILRAISREEKSKFFQEESQIVHLILLFSFFFSALNSTFLLCRNDNQV